MNKKAQRNVIFISHATPGDNAFSIWLASRLGLAGYNVWCDQEKLLGGEDFWKDIERTIRNRCIKMVLVVSQNAFDENGELRDGISKEVALADILKKSLGDERFLIPVRINDVNFSDFSVEFIRLNGIDCKDNWSKGLHQLLKAFERDELPKKSEPHHSIKAWHSLQQNLARNISEKPEKLQTNWLPITAKPEQLNFFEIKRTVEPNEVRSIASEVSLPCSDHGRLLVTYAEESELQSQLGQHTPIGFRGSLRTDDFLRGKTNDILGISPFDASNKITSIYRQAWNNFCSSKGLISYELANGLLAWWFPEDLIEDGNLRFTDFNGKPRRRAVQGYKGSIVDDDGNKTIRYHWHLGYSARFQLGDEPRLALQARIIISEDGKNPIENKTRLNSVRRSLTKNWYNDKWRTLLLGFANWVAGDNTEFGVPVSGNQELQISPSPMEVLANFGVAADPVFDDLSDEEIEELQLTETTKRLNDPLFRTEEYEEYIDDQPE